LGFGICLAEVRSGNSKPRRMHPQNASKKFRILIDDDKRLDADVIQQIFQSLNLNFGLDVDIFFLMPLPPTYAAKDTTAKRYNCDRYFYTHTHTCT